MFSWLQPRSPSSGFGAYFRLQLVGFERFKAWAVGFVVVFKPD